MFAMCKCFLCFCVSFNPYDRTRNNSYTIDANIFLILFPLTEIHVQCISIKLLNIIFFIDNETFLKFDSIFFLHKSILIKMLILWKLFFSCHYINSYLKIYFKLWRFISLLLIILTHSIDKLLLMKGNCIIIY